MTLCGIILINGEIRHIVDADIVSCSGYKYERGDEKELSEEVFFSLLFERNARGGNAELSPLEHEEGSGEVYEEAEQHVTGCLQDVCLLFRAKCSR